ncbi:transmembrane protein 248 [Kryptolebias marmoratus]|uniref:Transmembrane protein 248-like n=1 Tax=Kryptolebias marmoratus TaxID=37003 RepID=A0A3Q3G6S0_KRYMA|nr:transmembrane protein 248 [Kryptolebias marmoratus]
MSFLLSNLREYVSHNPPGATFFLCLLTLSISFIYFGSYSYTHSLPNPDIEKDWNVVLSSLTQFHLCEKINPQSIEQVSSLPQQLTEQEKAKTTSANSTISPASVTVLHLSVPLSVTTSSQSGSLKNIGLLANIEASQLHLGDKEMVNFTLQIVSDGSNCLTISAPTNILPTTPLPPKCSASGKNISTIPVEVSGQLEATSQTCYRLNFKKDPSLTVMLTLKEKRVAVRHLMEISVLLLTVCLLLCLAASLTNSNTRYKYHSGLGIQNGALTDS